MQPPLAKVFLEAARVRTLPAALAPVVLGLAIAVKIARLDVLNAICALGGALAIQVGTNYANDYFDFVKGADTDARKGPRRATQAGLVTPQTMRRAFVAAFACACVFGAVLLWRTGPALLLVGVLSIAAGILYTGGPKPLGYLGLGDLLVLVFFGPVAVAGTTFTQTGRLDTVAVLAGIAPGLLATAILAVNNLRDRETDAPAGKRTLAVRFGAGFVRAEYVACMIGAYGVAVMLAALERDPLLLLPLLSAPLAFSVTREMLHLDGAALNPLLGKTARALLAFTALWAVGFVL